MSHFFIIDTNVVVAGLITGQTDSPVVRILDGMLGAAFPSLRTDLMLVTGDKRLLVDTNMQSRVISPLALVARFQH